MSDILSQEQENDTDGIFFYLVLSPRFPEYHFNYLFCVHTEDMGGTEDIFVGGGH